MCVCVCVLLGLFVEQSLCFLDVAKRLLKLSVRIFDNTDQSQWKHSAAVECEFNTE